MAERNQRTTDTLNIKGHVGQQGKNFINATGENVLLPVDNGYEYQTGIVIDVISDPSRYFAFSSVKERLLSRLNGDDQKFNFIEKTPKNSIICQIIDNGTNEYSKNQIICWPFFPPFISLPVKPGEHVWILKEVTGDISRYYWMCRKHSAYHVDNLNYTSHEREINIYNDSKMFSGVKKLKESETIIEKFDFPQVVRSSPMLPSLNPDEIVKVSNSFKEEFTNEPVPNLSKKCGDLLFQGSNNAIIHLTQEKFTDEESKLSRYPDTAFAGNTESSERGNKRSPFSPAIDICVARKKNELMQAKSLIGLRQVEDKNNVSDPIEVTVDGLNFIKNSRIGLEGFESYEINKLSEFMDSDEVKFNPRHDIDIDIKNCGARVYLSNNCNIDDVFNIGSGANSENKIFDRFGGSVFAAYGEHTRLVSDGTFRIVNNFKNEEKDITGSTYIEIDNSGKVSIGSLNGDVDSAGGVSGMQSFVKGEELEVLLQRLIDEIGFMIADFNKFFRMNTTPGFGAPNLALQALLPPKLDGHKVKFDTIKEELGKFKSKLIRGE